ncbi:MAG: hypothetical protein K8S54_05250 [Spirochaetia bacterium]|nr:hypothetical protein [Spirochaetia bacterium]
MSRLTFFAVLAFFIYYVTFLTGRPAFEASDAEPGKATSAQLTIKPGLIHRALLQKKALTLRDSLLESDAEPERLFRNLERSYSGDLFYSGALAFWCASFLLCAISLRQRVWFGRTMAWLLLVPSVLSMLLVLFGIRRELYTTMREPYDALFMSSIETFLFLLGAAALIRSSIFANRQAATPFLDHLQTRQREWLDYFRRAPITALQVAAISVASALIANFVVLPVYYLQMSFPTFFAFLLFVSLAGLAVFYVRAYGKVAHAQNPNPQVSTAISFLGFRILTNTMFLTGVISILALLITLVVVLSIVNLDVLQTIGVLKKASRL